MQQNGERKTMAEEGGEPRPDAFRTIRIPSAPGDPIFTPLHTSDHNGWILTETESRVFFQAIAAGTTQSRTRLGPPA